MLFLSNLIKDALYFSAQAHDGQFRKGGKVPYIVHPVLVAGLVSEYSSDENIIAAALLHDVMEDCGTTEINLREKFGVDVALLVKEVSYLEEDKTEGSWRERKSGYLEKIKAISKDGLVIIACDKMTNMKVYFEALKTHPDKVATLFSGSSDDYEWYYEQVGAVLKDRLGDISLTQDYWNVFSNK